HIIPALPAQVAVGEPVAALLDGSQLHCQVQNLANLADSFPEHNVKLCFLEGRCHLVLDHFGPGAVSDKVAAGILQALNTADINTDTGIIFQSPAACGDFRVAIDNAHLLTKLVDKDTDGVGLADNAGQLPESLAHQPGLKAY